MNIKRNFLAASAVLIGIYAGAETVTVTSAGTLSTLITDVETTSLTISGSINALDLIFLGQSVKNLTTLNLSDAVIEAVTDDDTEYAANTIPEGAFAGTKIASLTLPSSNDITIGDMAFAATDLTELSLGSNVVSVGQAAFAACSSLTSVEYTAATTFDSYVFANCANLAGVNINGSTTISDSEFANCVKLVSVLNAESVTTIGNYAFSGCTSLTSYAFTPALTTIGEGAFSASGITAADFTTATSLTSIGAKAFAGCTDLASVTFDTSAESDLTLGEGVFFGCTSLKTIELPMLKNIPDYALTSANDVTTITIPSTVEYIGDNAMTSMTGLTSVNVKELTSVPELGEDVWRNVAQETVLLDVENEYTSAFKEADQWREFKFTDLSTAADDLHSAAESVKARFEGTVLRIISSGIDIASVTLYDTAGVTLTAVNVNANSAAIATDNYQTRIYLVTVTLSNGNSSTIKLIRK